IRQPRPVGDETLVLPTGIGVDLATDSATTGSAAPYNFPGDASLPTPNPGGTIDILFSPNGEVVGYTRGRPRIIFWVRDFNNNSPSLGDPTLVGVWVRTGRAAAYDVDQSSTPYSLVN